MNTDGWRRMEGILDKSDYKHLCKYCDRAVKVEPGLINGTVVFVNHAAKGPTKGEPMPPQCKGSGTYIIPDV